MKSLKIFTQSPLGILIKSAEYFTDRSHLLDILQSWFFKLTVWEFFMYSFNLSLRQHLSKAVRLLETADTICIHWEIHQVWASKFYCSSFITSVGLKSSFPGSLFSTLFYLQEKFCHRNSPLHYKKCLTKFNKMFILFIIFSDPGIYRASASAYSVKYKN